MEKSLLRKTALETRKALSPEEIKEKSANILRRLQDLPVFVRAQTVLCYVSSRDNEVGTHPLIEWLLTQCRTVLVPISGNDRQLSWSRLHDLRELAPARFGILEPRPEFRRITPPPGDAVVIVPGIAFRRDGYRIGYGGGYYDRFLAGHPGAGIGLAFDVQIIESFHPEPHDVPLDYIVTEFHTHHRS